MSTNEVSNFAEAVNTRREMGLYESLMSIADSLPVHQRDEYRELVEFLASSEIPWVLRVVRRFVRDTK